MSRNINTKKAVALDGIDAEFFNVARHEPCRNNVFDLCELCKKKLKIIRLFLQNEFWQTELGKNSRKGRYIAFNKVYPNVPTAE